MNRKKRSKLGISVFLCGLVIINSYIGIFILVQEEFCDGKCYTIHEIYEFGPSSYPRMTQVDDLLLVAYSPNSFVLDGINLTSKERVGPKTIIPSGIGVARSTLHYAEALDMVLCVYNHDAAASVGIAWAPASEVLNESAWTQQHDAVYLDYPQDFFHVGVWEPYLAPYNDTDFLLYVSNQTVYDPANPIDVNNYYFLLEGYKVVQKIDIFWMHWNGTGFDVSYCGAASHDIPGGPIHYKDGMASSVLVWENTTHKDYLMTFESFLPRPFGVYYLCITMVKIRVSTGGVETLWRRDMDDMQGHAPFTTHQGGRYVTSYGGSLGGEWRITFRGTKEDETTVSQPIFLEAGFYGWPSIFTDSSDRLWLACQNTETNKVTIIQLDLDFNWRKLYYTP
ncbi:MAG: hypothetical protein ACFFCS_13035 [Candidatus Hodarchaeota archaeon]